MSKLRKSDEQGGGEGREAIFARDQRRPINAPKDDLRKVHKNNEQSRGTKASEGCGEGGGAGERKGHAYKLHANGDKKLKEAETRENETERKRRLR